MVNNDLPKVTSKPSFLFVSTFNMLLQIMIECCLVSTNMAHFEVAFFGMTVTHMFLEAFLQRMSILALITFPRFLGLMLVHDMLLHMFVILKNCGKQDVTKNEQFCFHSSSVQEEPPIR